MEFFNDTRLALRLSQREVPEQEKLYYLFVFLLLHPLMQVGLMNIKYNKEFIEQSNLHLNQWSAAAIIISTMLTLMGSYYCFKRNQIGDSTSFIERFICLSFPIGIQSLGLGIIITLINHTILQIAYDGEIPAHDTILSPIQNAIVSFYFYFKLFKNISFLSKKSTN